MPVNAIKNFLLKITQAHNNFFSLIIRRCIQAIALNKS